MSLEVKMKGFEEFLNEDEMKILKQATEGPKTSPKITKWNDAVFPAGYSVETAQYCYKHLNLKQGDTLIAAYPKTGTFWMTEIIQHIVSQDEKEYGLPSNFPHALMFLEFAPSERFPPIFKIPIKRRLAFTHMPPGFVNVDKYTKEGAKIVCVLRNPKDQIVSFYKFIQKIPHGQVEPVLSMHNSGWDTFFNHVVQGDLPTCMKPGEWYPDHIRAWYKHKDNKNVYFIYYEDLQRDAQGQIKLLAKFLDAPVTDERAKEIAEASSFDNMKSKRATGNDFRSKFTAVNMRKGGVGGWKDYFTVSQSEKVDAMIEENLKDTNIKFTYEL